MNNNNNIESVRPGLHHGFEFIKFTSEESKIIRDLANEWYVTHDGEEIVLTSTSRYRFFLMKPTDKYREMFNIEREIVVLLSPYENFEPRTLDAIDAAIKHFPSLRIEKMCSVVISKDSAIESKLGGLLKNERESRIVIPFSYDELSNQYDPFFVRNRFKKHFYERDLFAFEAPLRKDFYFFGRNDLVQKIINRHKSNENSALFGLRKSGKTSIIYGVQRALEREDENVVVLDCQNTSLNQRRWNEALYFVIYEAVDQLKITMDIEKEEKYTPQNASMIFESEILRLYEKIGKKNILLIFDEIENISFSVSPSPHWAKDSDFIFFWQTLRSLFQKLAGVFSYFIVGTNAMCVETPLINGKDNPIFSQVPFEYVPRFDVTQTREMVGRLGSIMGLRFDESVYNFLNEDFGGQPFLIRHVCSEINSIVSSNRPAPVNKGHYLKAKNSFIKKYDSYFEMILSVLKEYYGEEYEMLEFLALGDETTFMEFASASPSFTNHLLGYGILDNDGGDFVFRIESVKEFLQAKSKYKKMNQTTEEMWAEISERRNILEQKLRSLIRSVLLTSSGKSQAKEIVLNIFGGERKNNYVKLNFDDLFDNTGERKNNYVKLNFDDLFDNTTVDFYFDDARKIIIKHWDNFKNVFSIPKEKIDHNMQFINKLRRDAHANTVSKDDMQLFRVYASALENQVKEFFG